MTQHEKEKIINDTKKFKQASGVLKYHVCPDILGKLIENTEEYRNGTDDVEKLFGRRTGYLFI